MKKDTSISTIRVFVDKWNQFGSPLGIVMDEEKKLSQTERQRIATELNYSETVFIDDGALGKIQVFSPIRECPFSMYAAVGSSWFIRNKLGHNIDALQSLNQSIQTFVVGDITWVSSTVSILPKWNLIEYQTAQEITSLGVHDFAHKEHVLVWAWIDKLKGIIRARTFANDWGIPEDEANGSGTMRLVALLQRDLTVIHGKGSVVYSKVENNNTVSSGGRCAI